MIRLTTWEIAFKALGDSFQASGYLPSSGSEVIVNACQRTLLLFPLLLGVQRPAMAVSEAVCYWLTTSPSTAANGMGSLASPYSTDPMVAWFLPGASAIGPGAADGVTIEVTGHSPRTNWLPALPFEMGSMGHKAARVRAPLGRALDQSTRRIPGNRWSPTSPMSLSFSVMQQDYRGEFEWKEWSTSARFEVGLHRRFWNFGAGLGYDFITSELDYFTQHDGVDVRLKPKAKSGTFDWGLVAERKLLNHVPLRAAVFPFQTSPFQLDLGVTGSWARNFVGGEIKYFPDEQGDPLPRGDRVALASRLRVVHSGLGDTRELELLRVHVAYEHTATLIDKYLASVQVNGIPDRDPGGHATDPWGDDEQDTYTFGLDYKLFEPGIFTYDDNTVRSWGAEVSLSEMITMRKGRFVDHEAQIIYNTGGWGLDSNGLFRLVERNLPATRSTPVLGWMLRNLRIRYDMSEWDSNPNLVGTQFRQVTVDVSF